MISKRKILKSFIEYKGLNNDYETLAADIGVYNTSTEEVTDMTLKEMVSEIYDALATPPTFEFAYFSLPLYADSTTVGVIDMSVIPNFQGLTIDDIKVTAPRICKIVNTSSNCTVTYSYNSTSGKFTITSDKDLFDASCPFGVEIWNVFIKPEYYTISAVTSIATTSSGKRWFQFDLTGIEDYNQLTEANIHISFDEYGYASYTSDSGTTSLRSYGIEYDPDSGILDLVSRINSRTMFSTSMTYAYIIINRF